MTGTASGPDPSDAEEALALAEEVLERALKLVPLLTVRQAIEAGDEATRAAGLNPWAINEGRADGSEKLSAWWIAHALERVKTAKGPVG
jgi:hypothetical protein